MAAKERVGLPAAGVTVEPCSPESATPRLRAPSPALVISVVALFVALGGTSLAAVGFINGKHIKPHSIPKNRLTKSAIASLHGAKGAQGPQGLPGIQGIPGVQGPPGPSSWDSLDGSSCTTAQGPAHTYVFEATQGPSHEGDTNNYGSGTWEGVALCLTPDDLEPNDTRTTATNATSFDTSLVYATIYPSTDNDWYELEGTDLSGHTIGLISLGDEVAPEAPKTLMDVFEDSTQVATGVISYAVPAASGTHNWFVHVYGTKPDFYDINFMG